jgi:integrase
MGYAEKKAMDAETTLKLAAVSPAASVADAVASDVRQLVGGGRAVDTALIDAATRGWSANTQRAFRSDLALWADWCRRQGIAAAAAAPSDITRWLRQLGGTEPAGEKQRAMATIERYLVHVGWAYRIAGLADPTAAPLVKLEKKALRKALGVRQRQARAIRYKGDISDLDSPARGVCLAHLLKTCRRDLLGLRDEALLRVAYDSAARRSELVAIQAEHIDGPDETGAGTLFVPRSKTDQAGEGAYAYLSPATMRATTRWRSAVRIERGPLFRRVEVHFDGSVAAVGSDALHPGSISLIYRRLIRAAHAKKLLGALSEAELERWVKAVSSHSIRVGVAQDNFAADESLPAIMQAYRWRDPKTVLRYGARLAARSGASARMAARFADKGSE